MRLTLSLLGQLAALTLTTAGWAQTAGVVLADDVETGTLQVTESPPGRWTELLILRPSVSMTASPAAAHRGSFGIRVDDQDVGTGSDNVASVEQNIPTFAEGYVRAWFRHSGGAATGDQMLFQFEQSLGDTELRVRPSMESLQVGRRGTGSFVYTGGVARVEAGTWHLLELGANGYGTSQGTLRVWVDGALEWTSPTFDLTGVTVTALSLGPSWSDD